MITFHRAPLAGLNGSGPLLLIEEGVERDVVQQLITSHIDVPSYVTKDHPKWPAHLAAMQRKIEEQLTADGWQFDGSPFWLCGRGCTCEYCNKRLRLGMVGSHNRRCTYCSHGFIIRGPKPVFSTGSVKKPVMGTKDNGFQPYLEDFARSLDYDKLELPDGTVSFVPSQTEYHSYWITAVWRRRGVRTQLDPNADVLVKQRS